MSRQSIYRTHTELHRSLPLFFQPWWLDVAATHPWDIALAEENGKVAAVFPFQTERKLGFRLLRTPALCPYLGPFFLSEEDLPETQRWKREERLLDALWQQLPRYDYLSGTTPPGYHHFLPLHQKGCTTSNRLTYLIDLSDPEATLLSRFQSRMRNYIRKAEQALTLKQGIPQELATLLKWHRHAFQKKGARYPFQETSIQKVIEAAEQHQASLFQTAYDKDGQPVAMLWTPFDHQTGYHLIAATAPGNQINGALAYLVQQAILLLKQKGLRYYDFEGSMDKGIEQFFRKFGGNRTPYLSFEQTHSRLWKIKKALLH